MVTLQELREKHQKLIQEQEGNGKEFTNNFIKFENGENLIRILPGRNEPLEFYVESAIHRVTNPDGKWSNYTCRRVHNEDCPLCVFTQELWDRHKNLNLGKDAEGKNIKSPFGTMAGKLKSKSRYYIRAVSRALQEKNEDPVKFIAMGSELFTQVMAYLTDPDYMEEDDPDNSTIISLDRGNDFIVKLSQNAGGFNQFEGRAKNKKTKAGTPAQIAEWMENALDLNSLVKIGEYEEGKKIVAMLEAQLNSGGEKVEAKKPTTEKENEVKFNKEMKV